MKSWRFDFTLSGPDLDMKFRTHRLVSMDHRDRLILALSALVRAEREVKSAWKDAIEADALSPKLLAAIGDHSNHLIDRNDIELAEAFVSPGAARAGGARVA